MKDVTQSHFTLHAQHKTCRSTKLVLTASVLMTALSLSSNAIAEKDTQTEVKEEIITHKEVMKTHIGQIDSKQNALPKKGITEDQVEQMFGQPTQKRAAKGQPPISSWVYPDFTVYFESGQVIHSVAFPATSKRNTAKGDVQ